LLLIQIYRVFQIEQFIVDPATLSIKSQAYQPAAKYQVVVNAEEPKKAQDVLPKTTFDMGLNLSEEERRSKAATRLPYTHAQNEQGLCFYKRHSHDVWIFRSCLFGHNC
jgi:tRNA U34 2-thiouridine synthase MnmA/TrmU